MSVKTYPVKDCIRLADRDKLGLPRQDARLSSTKEIRARATGKKRCPKKGDWYLSGAIVEAYRAPNDLNTVFCIATLCIVETVTEHKVVDMIS